jgi:hypothetical protein
LNYLCFKIQRDLKKALHISLSSLLAITLLFFGAGMTIEKHFCGDELKSVAVNEEAKSCCPHSSEAPKSEERDCCNDSSESIDLWDVPNSTQAPQHFVAVLPSFDIQSLLSSKEEAKHLIHPPNPPPPLPGREILIEIQKFTC